MSDLRTFTVEIETAEDGVDFALGDGFEAIAESIAYRGSAYRMTVREGRDEVFSSVSLDWDDDDDDEDEPHSYYQSADAKYGYPPMKD